MSLFDPVSDFDIKKERRIFDTALMVFLAIFHQIPRFALL